MRPYNKRCRTLYYAVCSLAIHRQGRYGRIGTDMQVRSRNVESDPISYDIGSNPNPNLISSIQYHMIMTLKQIR